MTWVLVIFMCSPGAMSGCSSGIVATKVEDLVSKEACEAAAQPMVKNRYYRGHTCAEVKKS